MVASRLRGDVPVVGGAQLQATLVIDADQRRQKTRFALVVQGKAEGGDGRCGQALEDQLRIGGAPHRFGIVDLDRGRLDQPLGQPFGAWRAAARRETRLTDHRAIGIQKAHLRGITKDRGIAQLELGLVELACEALDLQLKRWPIKHAAVAHDAHLALGPHGVGGLLVEQSICLDAQARAAVLRLAAQLDGVVLDHGHGLTREVHRAFSLGLLANGFQQARRLAQGERALRLRARCGSGPSQRNQAQQAQGAAHGRSNQAVHVGGDGGAG